MNETADKLNVLVTRPVYQSKRLSRLIEQAGGVAYAVPVIEILPASDPFDVQQTIGDIAQYDLLVFVSTNAVRHGRDYLPVEVSPDATVAAVGPTTAQALVRAGLGCDVKPRHGYSSENLLAEPRMQEVDGQRVIIFRGAGGRALLGETLTERGANVTYANVYRRRPPPASARRVNELLDADAVDVVTATSVETLCNIVDMAGEERGAKLRGLILLTASPRVVKKAAELQFAHDALLASGPDDKSLVAALQDWQARTAAAAHETPDRHEDRQESENQAENDPMVSDNQHKDASADTAPAPSESGPDGEQEKDPPGAAVPDDVATEQTPPAPPARTVKSGRGLAALAILLALLAGLAAGYNWWRLQSMGAMIDQKLAAIDAVVATVPDENTLLSAARQETERLGSEITRRVEERLSRVDLSGVDNLRAEQEQLDGTLRGQQRGISTLTNRLSGLEQDLSAMQGVSASVRNTWVRAEAEYFLQTANSRLQLANDIESALQALRAADERIGALGDPGLTPVRALLTEEILAVESVARPDIEGMALVLNGMTARVSELPFGSRLPEQFSRERGEDTETPNGWGRARETVSDVFTGIVRVSPSDGSDPALLAPEQGWFLVRNLELQLQVGRAALMEKDVENFKGSLRTAISWLDDYFNPEDQAVRSMRARLAEMEQVDIAPTVPDISGSLRLLRQIVSASGTSQ